MNPTVFGTTLSELLLGSYYNMIGSIRFVSFFVPSFFGSTHLSVRRWMHEFSLPPIQGAVQPRLDSAYPDRGVGYGIWMDYLDGSFGRFLWEVQNVKNCPVSSGDVRSNPVGITPVQAVALFATDAVASRPQRVMQSVNITRAGTHPNHPQNQLGIKPFGTFVLIMPKPFPDHHNCCCNKILHCTYHSERSFFVPKCLKAGTSACLEENPWYPNP